MNKAQIIAALKDALAAGDLTYLKQTVEVIIDRSEGRL